MPSIHSIDRVKSSLIGNIVKQKKKGNDIGSLLSNMKDSKLIDQIASTPSRRRPMVNPANLAVADRLDTSVLRRRAGARNIQNSALKSNTADAALQNASDIVGRLNELAASATDPLKNNSDRAALNAEAQALTQELNDLQNNASFNGQKILQGSSTSTFTGDSSITTTDADLTSVNTDVSSIDLSSSAGASAALSSLESAQTNLNVERAKVGANANRLSREHDFAITVANNEQAAADNTRSSSLGDIGSAFGPELAGFVNELLGLSF